MPTVYKWQFQMLCPYYVTRKARSLQCSTVMKFETKEQLEAFMKHNCYFAAPIQCEEYRRHRELVEQGLEEPKKPRESMDVSRKKYNTNYIRERRKDPDYKW